MKITRTHTTTTFKYLYAFPHKIVYTISGSSWNILNISHVEQRYATMKDFSAPMFMTNEGW